jgi:hypothetical protein
MNENTDGTLKSIPNVKKDPEVDMALSVIREQGQSKNFKIMDHIPTDSEGTAGNIILAKAGGAWYICGKTTDGWKKIIIT